MLNILWPFIIILSIVYCFIFGDIFVLSNSIFQELNSSVMLIISMIGSICFWNGIMNILKNTNILAKFELITRPIIKRIFPKLDSKGLAYKNITLNITSNIMGLGNASTPLGLKAMEELKKEEKVENKLSRNMKLFILINTASIQLIPTSVITLRSSLNSCDPSKIIIPVWIVSISVFLFVITIGNYFFKER